MVTNGTLKCSTLLLSREQRIAMPLRKRKRKPCNEILEQFGKVVALHQ